MSLEGKEKLIAIRNIRNNAEKRTIQNNLNNEIIAII